jgi:ADP-heptose:LPS heptosyltransferase
MTHLAIARLLHLNRKTVALYAHTQTVSPVSQPARAGIWPPLPAISQHAGTTESAMGWAFIGRLLPKRFCQHRRTLPCKSH